MTKTERLFQLMQLLRRHRFPIKGDDLAFELGVSLRTLYRDIAALQQQGADIVGEPGLGYVLRPGFLLPPLMFSDQELEALVLGCRWVAKKTDSQLQQGANDALAKIAAVLPQELRQKLELSGLLIGPNPVLSAKNEEEKGIRQAIRDELKIAIDYNSLQENLTHRVIWPIALSYFDGVRVLISWCELRNDFRHFRADRIEALEVLKQHYPKRRVVLLKQWRLKHAIAND